MAREGYQEAPEIAPSLEAPSDYSHAEPGRGAASLAEGASALGQGLLDASKFYGQVAADNGTNNTLEQVTHVLHGDPSKMVAGPDGTLQPDTGFFGKRGADAMSAREETDQRIHEIIQDNREGLQSPLARLQYDNETRRYRAQWQQQMGTYADDQQKVWSLDTNKTASTIGLNSIAMDPMNDAGIADSIERVRASYVKTAQIQYGSSPEIANGAVLKADQDIAITRVHSLIGDNRGTDAQKVFDDNRGILGSLSNYDALNQQVKASVVNQTMVPAVNDYVATVVAGAQGVTGSVTNQAIKNAFWGQESGNRSNIRNSDKGAVGPGQVEPATFAAFAHPGEDITNPDANRAVSGRIIDKYMQDYNGDVSRVAVAYFSGPGNVAPPGSATPWIHDRSDGHTLTSQYVAGIQRRTTAFPTTADALNASLPDIYSSAEKRAQELFPDNPPAQNEFVGHAVRSVQMHITQMDAVARVDSHVVEASMAKTNAISLDQLRADPNTAAALDRMATENPMGYMGLERRLDANAHGAAINFGGQFSHFLDRVLADPKDPNAITRPDQLNNFVGHGKTAFITNTGIQTLTALMQLNQGPGGHAQAVQIRQFMNTMHSNLTFSSASAGLVDPKGEDKYAQFSSIAIPALVNAAKGGKLASLLNPNSPDYVGNMATPFMRSQTEIMDDQLRNSLNVAPVAPPTIRGADVASVTHQLSRIGDEAQRKAALRAAVAGGSVNRQIGEQIAETNGWIAARNPVPMAQ